MSGRRVGSQSRGFRVRGVVAAAALFVAGLAGSSSHASGVLRIEVLSNRADLVSGGDALVRVDLPSGVSASDVTMLLGADDVTSQFALRANGNYEGLLTGLALGPNVLKALLPDSSGAQITITNHPIGGPVFSGPHLQPWICTTEANGLGAAQDLQCNAPTKYEFFYRQKASGQYLSYDRNNPPPAGTMAQTTTDEGITVPFIVRLETGTMDRGIYQIAVLYDPTQPWEPWAPQPQWNHKLYYPFGGACGAHYDQGFFSSSTTSTLAISTLAPALGPVGPAGRERVNQGALYGGPLTLRPLDRGYAVATSTLNVLAQNCNAVVSAEATMMLQERLKETLGSIRYTIGEGGSGGAINQHQISEMYPGLLQGIRPTVSFPDMWSPVDFDGAVVGHYFSTTDQTKVLWANPLQRQAVCGRAITKDCSSRAPGYSDPTNFIGCGLVPAGEVYDPETNPDGVRCGVWDYYVNELGRRPPEAWGPVEKKIGHGFANRPWDNVGVQYGLTALQSGDISSEQFVDLNEKVGGFDIDNQWQPARTVADPAALEAMYRGSIITSGRGLRYAAILDIRAANNEDVHENVMPYITRARLQRSNGTAKNQVLWQGIKQGPFGANVFPTADETLNLMDGWLSSVEADHRDVPLDRKIIEDKPAQAVDSCWVGPVQVEEQPSTCQAIPGNEYYGSPNLAAGMPLTSDIFKCQLKPLQRSDYLATLTDAQWSRLQATFPTGVCDWSKPGVDQGPPAGSWMTYENGPGGVPLGPAPVSTPI